MSMMNHIDFVINTDEIGLDEVTDDIYNKYMQTLEVRK